MDCLKDNNSEIFKMLFEGNVIIRLGEIENGQY